MECREVKVPVLVHKAGDLARQIVPIVHIVHKLPDIGFLHPGIVKVFYYFPPCSFMLVPIIVLVVVVRPMREIDIAHIVCWHVRLSRALVDSISLLQRTLKLCEKFVGGLHPAHTFLVASVLEILDHLCHRVTQTGKDAFLPSQRLGKTLQRIIVVQRLSDNVARHLLGKFPLGISIQLALLLDAFIPFLLAGDFHSRLLQSPELATVHPLHSVRHLVPQHLHQRVLGILCDTDHFLVRVYRSVLLHRVHPFHTIAQRTCDLLGVLALRLGQRFLLWLVILSLAFLLLLVGNLLSLVKNALLLLLLLCLFTTFAGGSCRNVHAGSRLCAAMLIGLRCFSSFGRLLNRSMAVIHFLFIFSVRFLENSSCIYIPIRTIFRQFNH